MVSLALIDELLLEFTNVGIGLGFGDFAGHHAGHVEVFDDEVPEFADRFAGHPVLGVPAHIGDAAVQVVNATLCFPPAA